LPLIAWQRALIDWNLTPDRADVILPAIEIYDIAMQCGGVEKILVPDVSLRDGIIQVLYEKAYSGNAPHI